MTTFMPTLRPARFADQPRMARVCSAAFWNNDLFGDMIHPHRKQFPDDMDKYFLADFRRDWFSTQHHFLVSTVPDAKRPGRDLVIGVAAWERCTAMRRWDWNPLRWLSSRLLQFWVSLSEWMWPNRAADPSKTTVLHDSAHFVEHLWTGKRAECWDLHLLCVDPAYGGFGAGRQLVRWGLDRAAEEDVSASVIMAPGKERFYEKCGFDPVIVGNGGMGDGNPLRHADGGNIYFWDPKS